MSDLFKRQFTKGLTCSNSKKICLKEKQAKFLGVLQGTVLDYVCRNHTIYDHKHGHKPVFSPMVEAEMVKAATDAAQIQLGLSRYQFMAKAGNVAHQMDIRTPWKTAPGKNWLHGVCKCNDEFTIRKPEALSTVRAKGLNSETAGESFLQLYELYHKYDLFKHPEQIHNMEESHYSFQH